MDIYEGRKAGSHSFDFGFKRDEATGCEVKGVHAVFLRGEKEVDFEVDGR